MRTVLKTSALGLGLISLAVQAQEAAPAEEATDTLPPVVVTAEKSGRSLMDTPTSSFVLDGLDLENRPGYGSTKEVLERMPNVTVVGTGNQVPTVRGVDGTGAAKGADAFFAGSRPRLNVQIDGRPVSYNEVTFGDNALWDVERVEVLIGPQSALQGRNAIAGTIATTTREPVFTHEGAVQVGAGNYDQRSVAGMVSGPLSESLAWRLAGDWSSHHSYIDDFIGYPSVDDPGEFESLNLRGKLLWQPKGIAGLRSLLTLSHSDYTGPQTEDVKPPFEDREAAYRDMPVFEPRSTSLISDTRYAITSHLNFEGLVSVTDLGVKRKAPAGTGIVDLDAREFVLEPRLRYQGEGRLGGVAGVYLFRADQNESIDFPSPQTFDDEVTTAAVFGEATLPLNADFDLIAGLRYEQEQHRREGGDGTMVAIDLDETYRAFLPKLGLAWHLSPRSTLGTVVSRGYNGGGGGFNVNTTDPSLPFITNYQYDPEYAWNYEIYGRQELAGGRVRLTANLFYTRYRDMQLSFDLTPADPTDYSFVVRNADKAVSYGAEAGAEWVVLRGLEVYANLGLLRSRITRYPGSGFQGNDQPFAPRVAANTGLSWNQGDWDAGFGLRYSGSYESDLDNLPRGEVGPYWLADAKLGHRWGELRLSGSVRNLFDSDEPLSVYSGTTAADDVATMPRPRTWWVGVDYRW